LAYFEDHLLKVFVKFYKNMVVTQVLHFCATKPLDWLQFCTFIISLDQPMKRLHFAV